MPTAVHTRRQSYTPSVVCAHLDGCTDVRYHYLPIADLMPLVVAARDALSEPKVAARPSLRDRVAAVLAANGGPMTVREIARTLAVSNNTGSISCTLSNLWIFGEISRLGHGLYRWGGTDPLPKGWAWCRRCGLGTRHSNRVCDFCVAEKMGAPVRHVSLLPPRITAKRRAA